MERFAKSVESLRSFLADKEPAPGLKNEKILHLTAVADFTCDFNDSKTQEFSQLLATVIEIILLYCGDNDSDVRSNAAECLEKISKTKINFVFKILANIFKEMKRCDNPRSLKVALNHISDLIPYVQIQKFRIIQISFGPEICRLAARDEESVLEALPSFIDKVYSVLGAGLSQRDVITLSLPFLENLRAKNAVVRRSASQAIYHICRHSSSPVANIVSCISKIFRNILPLDSENTDVDLLVGSVTGARHLLLILEQHEKFSDFGTDSNLVSLLVLCFEFFCELAKHKSSVVVTASLEAILTLLKICPPSLKQILVGVNGITKCQLFDTADQVLGVDRSGVLPESGSGDDAAANLEDSARSEVPLFTNKLSNSMASVASSTASNISQGRLTASSTSSSTEDLPEMIKALASKSTTGDNDEALEPVEPDNNAALGLEYQLSSGTDQANDGDSHINLDIGTYASSSQSAIRYALRLIASQFLLTGEKSGLKSDSQVRISIKSLALQIVAQICAVDRLKDLRIPLAFGHMNNVQIMDDILKFSTHSDPQLRSGCAQIYGAMMRSILDANCLEVSSFYQCIENLLSCLSDPEYPVVRSALAVLTANFQKLSELCPDSALIVDILEAILFLKPHKYWLVRVSVLEFFQCLDFNYVMVHELNSVTKSGVVFSLQNQILQFILEQLHNSNHNVRESASKTFANIIPKLYVGSSDTNCNKSEVLSQASADTYALYSPQYRNISEVFKVDKSMQFQRSYSRVENADPHNLKQKLSFVISLMFQNLSNVRDEEMLSGSLKTLLKIMESYGMDEYSESWNLFPLKCDDEDALIATKKFGHIQLCMNLITSSVARTNVITLANLIELTISLLSSTAVRFLDQPANFDDSQKVKRDWPVIKNDVLAGYFGKFFHHLLKVLNIIDHVLRSKEPVASPTKSSSSKLPTNLPSLPAYFPTTPTIPSPIRKKSQKLMETAVTKAKNTGATLPSLPTKFLEDAAKKDLGLNIFSNAPTPPHIATPPKALDPSFCHDSNLVQLYEVLVNINKAVKVSSLTGKNDKLVTLTAAVLKATGSLFQFASVREISLYVDSILRQVEGCLHVTPVEAVNCVQNLFHSVFGTSYCHNPSQNIMGSSFPKTKRFSPGDGKNNSLYAVTFTDPYMLFTQHLAPETSSASGEPGSGNLKREMKAKTGQAWAFQSRMPLVNHHIKSFETLVLNALRKYSSSSQASDRLITIELLCQLINLRVNYNLLDNEHTFLRYLSDQLDILSEFRGDVPDVYHQLVGHAMAFYVQLSHQKCEDSPIVFLEKITQHCSALCKVNRKLAIAALTPVAHDLFTRRGISANDPEEQNQNASANPLETSGSTAARQIVNVLVLNLSDCPESWDMIIVSLKYARHEGEMKHKTFSRQCFDNLMPLLDHGEVTFSTLLDVERLQQILSLLHPSLAVHETILRLFFKVPPIDSFVNFKNYLSVALSVIHILCKASQDETLLGRVKDLKNKIVSDSSPVFKFVKPEDLIANQILYIVSTLVTDCITIEIDSISTHVFRFFQYIQFMIKSSSPFAKKVAESFAKLINGAQMTQVLPTNVITLNEKLKRELSSFHPYLFLQWCDILFSVGYTRDQSWWPSILTPIAQLTNEPEASTGRKTSLPSGSMSVSETFLTKACFLLLIDSAVITSVKDTEPMSWAIINHLTDICSLMEEPPVVDFLNIVYQSPALSALLVQKLFDTNVLKFLLNGITKYKLLNILKNFHPTASHKVFMLLCGTDELINSNDVLLQRGVVTIAIAKLQHLTNSTTCDQLPLEELSSTSLRLLQPPIELHKRYPSMIDHLVTYFRKYSSSPAVAEFFQKFHNLTNTSIDMSSLSSVDEDFVKHFVTLANNLSPENYCNVITAMKKESVIEFLTSREVSLPVIHALFKYLYRSKDRKADEQLLSVTYDLFLKVCKKLIDECGVAVGNIDHLLGSTSFCYRLNLFVVCFEYYISLCPEWVQNLSPYGAQILLLIENCLDKFLLDCSKFSGDVTKLLKIIPYAAILTQTMNQQKFQLSVKLCKLLLLLTRNLWPDCFPVLKSAQNDDVVLTIRESSACALLLQKQTSNDDSWAFYLRQALVSLCRHPSAIEISRIPTEMWKSGFSVESLNEPTKNIDASFLIEPEIFSEFQNRTEMLGWKSRQSFEEIWMIYLTVLNCSNDDEYMELEEKWKVRKMSFNAIISLVAVALRSALPGNPVATAPHTCDPGSKSSKYKYVRRSVSEIHYGNVAKLKRELVNSRGPMLKSASIHFGGLLSQQLLAELPDNLMEHAKVDLNSCVVLLNEQCHHWLTDSTIPTSVVCDVFKGLILLSNLYVDTNQFDWLYLLISDLHRTLPAEDELTALYTIPLLCQSLNASTEIERPSEETEHLVSIFVNGLNSTMLSIETTTLCGLSLLMKCTDKNRSILRPVVSHHLQNYVTNRITAATSLVGSTPSQHYMLSLVAVAFDTIVNFIDDLRESEFISTTVQMFLVYAGICNKNVFAAILSRIDELVINQSLNRRVVDFVIKTCFEHIKNSTASTSLKYSLSVLLSCIYSYYPPAVHNLESDENISIDSIERVTRIIEKFEFSSTQHAKIIAQPLSRLMIDYLNLHERFYKATSLMQKHRKSQGKNYSVYLVADIFQDFINGDSQKVLLELLWPPFPSIIGQFDSTEDACSVLLIILFSAIESPYSHALIGCIVDHVISPRANSSAVVMNEQHSLAIGNNESKLILEQLTFLVVKVFYKSLDCEFDRVQFKDSLTVSNIKFLKDLVLNL